MRTALLLPLALVACLPETDDLSAPEAGVGLPEAELALSPEPLIDLVEDPRLVLGLPNGCALHAGQVGLHGGSALAGEALADEALADEALSDVALEGAERGVGAPSPQHRPLEWASDCLLDDGATVDGVLTWTHTDDGAVLLGDRFVLRRDGRTELELDGLIELTEQGDLLLLTVAAAWCGPGGPACEDTLATVDLAYTLFPAADYPTAYSVTVEGAVGTDDAVMAVEGMWAIDDQVCAEEPVFGVLSLRGARGHALELDGAERCDGCGTWAVASSDDPGWCVARF